MNTEQFVIILYCLVAIFSQRTILPLLYFALLNMVSADKVSDTTGDAILTLSWLQKLKNGFAFSKDFPKQQIFFSVKLFSFALCYLFIKRPILPIKNSYN